jgi:hypothetical protein
MQPSFEQEKGMSKEMGLERSALLTWDTLLEEANILVAVNAPQLGFEMKQIVQIFFVDMYPWKSCDRRHPVENSRYVRSIEVFESQAMCSEVCIFRADQNWREYKRADYPHKHLRNQCQSSGGIRTSLGICRIRSRKAVAGNDKIQ